MTIRDLPNRTKQEIFDYVSNHLLKQGNKAATIKEKRCAYRIEQGGEILRCAVGCLIPDSEYKVNMEGGSVRYLLRIHYEDIDIVMDRAKVSLLAELQHLHDNCSPYKWKEGLTRIANYYNLKFNH